MDIKMKNYQTKTNFVIPQGLTARANKTGINFMIFIVIFVEKRVCNTMLCMIFSMDENRF